MFDKDFKTTSEDRFHNRIALFRVKKIPVMVHHFYWFVHNCIAHPLIGVMPIKLFFDFHDWTSDKINAVKKREPAIIRRTK